MPTGLRWWDSDSEAETDSSSGVRANPYSGAINSGYQLFEELLMLTAQKCCFLREASVNILNTSFFIDHREKHKENFPPLVL